MKLTLGQKLWWISLLNHKEAYEVTVVKVGSRWAQLSNRHRISIETMVADGGRFSAPGHCVVSKEAHEQEKMISTEWGRLKNAMYCAAVPKGVTQRDILEARRLLKV